MTDKRKCYKLEDGYCRSDYSFYSKRPESVQDVDLHDVLSINTRTGTDKWYCIDTYTLQLKYTSEHVMVLVNDQGHQIETCGYGWYNVPTEHDEALALKKEYAEFHKTLGDLKVPDGLRRWHAEVCEMFENQHEEILFYGDEK